MGSSKVVNGLVVAALVMATILGAALPVLAEGPREVDREQIPPVEWWGEGQRSVVDVPGVVDVPTDPVMTESDGETRILTKLRWWWSATLGSTVD